MNRRSAIKKGVGALAIGGGLAVAARYGGRALAPRLARESLAGRRAAADAAFTIGLGEGAARFPKLAAVDRFFRRSSPPSAAALSRAQTQLAVHGARHVIAGKAAEGARFAERRAGRIGLGGAGAGAVVTPSGKKKKR